MTGAIFQKSFDEIGLSTFLSSPRDVYLIILQRCIRLLVYGQSSIVLTAFLKESAFTEFQMGLFMTLTLLGDAAGSLILTIYADRLGRAKVLFGGSLLMVASGLVFASSQTYIVLLLAAMIGVITPSGNEIGPFRPIEESILAQLADSDDRSTIFAWYFTLSGLALALGNLSGGWLTRGLQLRFGWTAMRTYRGMFLLYSMAGLLNSALAMALSAKVEIQRKPRLSREEEDGLFEMGEEEEVVEETKETTGLSLSPETKKKVWLLSALFGVDNFSGGLVPVTIIVYFFTDKFHIDEGTLGNTFFTTSLVAAISNIVAGSLARRFGNVKTMAFTHLPSAILLALVPVPSNFQFARAILIAVFCTTKMDIAPRTAFLTSYVSAEERTAVMGIINVVKMFSQSLGPTVTGLLASHGKIWLSFGGVGIVNNWILHVYEARSSITPIPYTQYTEVEQIHRQTHRRRRLRDFLYPNLSSLHSQEGFGVVQMTKWGSTAFRLDHEWEAGPSGREKLMAADDT
ncbi:Major facilitator superfamily domain-containing protein [Mycena venus]|uniref:Major facilitator superfamily domain-containing protein n=1 Tax=Mycena venus TaxID=2733690 RepID=A0A8H7D980_9AGAR|nr:Major facilitator superfamily domain-containing protein [Mycena venus]